MLNMKYVEIAIENDVIKSIIQAIGISNMYIMAFNAASF